MKRIEVQFDNEQKDVQQIDCVTATINGDAGMLEIIYDNGDVEGYNLDKIIKVKFFKQPEQQ